jgi:hypothetical protein
MLQKAFITTKIILFKVYCKFIAIQIVDFAKSHTSVYSLNREKDGTQKWRKN